MWLCTWLYVGTGLAVADGPAQGEPASDKSLMYERDIRPILREHCLDCHGAAKEKKGGLDLRLRRLMVKGGESGPAIVPGQPEESLLVKRLRDQEMPPGGKRVPPNLIARLALWVEQGASTVREEPVTLNEGIGITPEEREFWSLQPVTRPPIPKAEQSLRIRTPIDAFVFARMQSDELGFRKDADPAVLVRRVYLDLTGLPPTRAEVRAFVRNPDEEAFLQLLDRVLASPHYGERWGRHWLDVAGYADSEGYTNADDDRPWAYKYRDYVIRSFNQNRPLDEFICEQLAGDEMVALPYNDLTNDQISKLSATGFLRMAADGTGSDENDNENNNDEARNRTLTDTIKIVSGSLLGLSVECAQCHDHRYDPIPQRDYYQLRAIFEPALDWKNWRTPEERLISLYTPEDRAAAAVIETKAGEVLAEKQIQQDKYLQEALEKELSKHDPPLRDQIRQAYKTAKDQRTEDQKELLRKYPSTNITTDNLYQYNPKVTDELKKYDEQVTAIRATKPVEEFIRGLTEVPDRVPLTRVFYRGDYSQPTESVTPAALTITSAPQNRFEIPENEAALPTTGRRLAFARWLTNGRHPLVARVIVNRVWMHHFGRGLVATPGDFGKLGQPPSHPALLDWLASELVAGSWNMKKIHKRIMTSTVYRQSSVADARSLQVDSANRLLARFPVQRLDAEVVRDRILWTSGRLEESLFGQPSPIAVDDSGQVTDNCTSARRSVYVAVKRSQPVPILEAFDAPVMVTNCDCRSPSTAVTQSLILMNGGFVLQQSDAFAKRVIHETGMGQADDPGPAIHRAWSLAYCRKPTSIELAEARTFLATQLQRTAHDKEQDVLLLAMTNLCQVLMGSNEFLYVD